MNSRPSSLLLFAIILSVVTRRTFVFRYTTLLERHQEKLTKNQLRRPEVSPILYRFFYSSFCAVFSFASSSVRLLLNSVAWPISR